MRSFPFLIAALLACMHCRGREHLGAHGAFREKQGQGVVAFLADNPEPRKAVRAVIIDPASGEAGEVELKSAEALSQVIAEPFFPIGNFVISRSGNNTDISRVFQKKQSSYFSCNLSPTAVYVACHGGNGVHVLDLRTQKIREEQGELRQCQWRSSVELLCLEGAYQKERRIVTLAAGKGGMQTVQQSTGRISQLAVNSQSGTYAWATGTGSLQKFFRRRPGNSGDELLGSIENQYVFDLRVSFSDVVAALVVPARRDTENSLPRNLWVSREFTGQAGVLLKLAELPAPGFFSGAGFGGVESFDFSPDGSQLAILMSGANDCRMVDEGGNVACRLNVHIYDGKTGVLRQLTQFQATELHGLVWREWRSVVKK